MNNTDGAVTDFTLLLVRPTIICSIVKFVKAANMSHFMQAAVYARN